MELLVSAKFPINNYFSAGYVPPKDAPHPNIMAVMIMISYLCEIILNFQGRDLIIPEQRLDGCSGASTATVLITGRQVTACDSHGMGEGPSES